jgi:hypothetical protein
MRREEYEKNTTRTGGMDWKYIPLERVDQGIIAWRVSTLMVKDFDPARRSDFFDP